jgi:DNA-binding transcriptional ArsR family regulator
MFDRVLQAIADPVRRQILDALRTRELSAGDVAELFPEISRPAVSQHLGVLREAQLVQARKEGRRHLYSLNANPLHQFWEEWLSKYETLWKGKLLDLKRAVESETDSRDKDK